MRIVKNKIRKAILSKECKKDGFLYQQMNSEINLNFLLFLLIMITYR